MVRSSVSWLSAVASLAGPLYAGAFDPVWQLGADDNQTAPFGQENWASNNPPGSASAKDDDYYLAGTYPAPIGTLASDEPLANFERANPISDPRKRVHFPLTAAQISSTSRLRVTIDLFAGGGWVNNASIPGFQSHDITVKLNGVELGIHPAIRYNTTLVYTIPASSVNARLSDNVLQIERTGGTANSYIQFDYLRLEADPDALQDEDGDGMPKWFEEIYNLDDTNAADAALDPDSDGLSNLQEFQRGTNPTDPDSDNDGLTDSQETATDPLNPDTDGDGLSDGSETTSNPLLADSDGDGYPDNIEIEQGTNPLSAASKPFDFPGAVGFQFIAERRIGATLNPGEPAGLFRLPNWNASTPLPMWPPTNTALTGSASALKNHRGQATTVGVSWSYRASTDGLHRGPSDEKLLSGMIYAGSYTVSGVTSKTPASLSLTGIPYPTYDLIVYLGDVYPGRLGTVQLGAGAATKRYFVTESNPPFMGWKEAKATTQAAIAPANYVRYRNLSGAAQSITVEQLQNENVSIHGFQIIDSGTDSDGDGMTDATEVEHRFNPKVADATADADGDGLTNAAELALGTDPHNRDTDHDGLDDGAEAAANANPLLPDTDGDGLTDGDEVFARPFPSLANKADSDNDGFSDSVERTAGSDPMLAASVPPAVPVWNAANRTWTWRTEPLRLVWNHDRAMLGAIAGDETMLCEAVVGRAGTGWNGQLGIGIRYYKGRLSYRVRCGAAAFKGTNGQGYWYGDWATIPTDRTAAFGFSGYGPADESDPLRLEFIATRAASGSTPWSFTAALVNVANPAAPVTIATISQTNAIAGDTAIDTGTATWSNADNVADFVTIDTEPGITAYFTRSATAAADNDHDGMPDAWESANMLNPSSAADATLDPDHDGLINRDEWLAGTNPQLADTDGDGAPDGVEVLHGSNPLSSTSLPPAFAFAGNIQDLDGDGLSDAWVMWSGGKPRLPHADDDGDGMTNAQESAAGTDPDDPASKLAAVLTPDGGDLIFSWTDLPYKSHTIETSGSLIGWGNASGLPASSTSGGERHVRIPGALAAPEASRFYRAKIGPIDTDADGVEDWTEVNVLGSSPTSANSLGQPITRANGQTLSGDALALQQRMAGSSPTGGTPGSGSAGSPSPVQAARFLMQSTFGPVPEDIAAVRQSGYAAWIDAQLQLPPSYLQPYIRRIKADGAGPRADRTYNFNELDKFVHGNNVTTPFARNAIGAPDQLRQRVAFALSQILVVSRRDAQLEEKPEAMAHYYDTLVRNSLGNYGTLLKEVTLHPAMGWYLSHVGNQKADPSIPRYPDENYAREVMQLFTIGLWELNPDGSRKLDPHGEPIPTYDNGTITEMARVFTGLYFDAPYGWNGGGWADEHYTKPMVMYPEHHDFGRKTLLHGFILPEREESAANGMQEVIDAVDSIFRHPNTPPFVSKQLIQFLVTDNPSPAYIRRVQDVFVNDGTGTRGNLGAVVKAILLDPEARGLPTSPDYGKVREPVIRTMHLGRLFKLAETHPDFTWWNWQETYYGYSFQEPMNSPSVFNFYTPVYQAPGDIRNKGLVSPGFQLVNTYSSVSFPNLMLDYLHGGFRSSWSWFYPLDYRAPLLVAGNPAALVDHVDLLVCAGNMTARTRSILLEKLANPALTQHDRVALAVWLAMVCPEGAVQR